MGIARNFFAKRFGKLKVHKSSDGVSIDLDFEFLGKKLDYAQSVLDAQIWQDVQQYMPHDTGALRQATDVLNKSVHGEVYLYPPDSEYGRYQYGGIVYVDPVYGKGAFYDPNYGFWSRKGVTKVPSDRPLQYKDPNAHAEWGQYAIDVHLKEWEELVKRTL